jgi:hypothetical protein
MHAAQEVQQVQPCIMICDPKSHALEVTETLHAVMIPRQALSLEDLHV